MHESTLTAMSGPARVLTCGTSWFARLVRSSHPQASVVMALLACACVFQEPPDWEPPKKTRPQLMDPTPSPFKIYSVNDRRADTSKGLDTFDIYVDERSEDDGDDLRAIMFLNYNGNKGPDTPASFLNYKEVPAGTFDVVKSISLGWRVSGKGCTLLTLIVTHVSNVDPESHFPIDNSDVASITWWLNVNNPGDIEVSCPVSTLADTSSTGAP